MDITDTELTGADPVAGIELPSADSLAAAVLARPARRRHRRVAAGITATVLLTASGTAAAVGISAHTGHRDDEYGAHFGELLLVGGPGFDQIVRTQAPEPLPLPPGDTWPRLVDRELTAIHAGDRRNGPAGTLQSLGGIRRSLEGRLTCHWLGYWLAAHSRGDLPAQRTAATVLTSVPSWPQTSQLADAMLTGAKQTAQAVARSDVASIQIAEAGFCGFYDK